jgi:hypothetical protein
LARYIARCRAGFHQMLGRRQLFGIVMDPIVITFITACTAFVSAIVGPFITFRIGKAQISASVLSANRQKWIEEFRDLAATFCSQAIAASLVREKVIEGGRIIVAHDSDLLRRLEELTKTFTKIRLMTNPIEPDHQVLIKMLASIMTTLRTAPVDTDLEGDIQTNVDAIVATTQVVLKREWVRVKSGR